MNRRNFKFLIINDGFDDLNYKIENVLLENLDQLETKYKSYDVCNYTLPNGVIKSSMIIN